MTRIAEAEAKAAEANVEPAPETNGRKVAISRSSSVAPRTRARAFGCPRRAASPAASTITRSVGWVRELIVIMRG